MLIISYRIYLILYFVNSIFLHVLGKLEHLKMNRNSCSLGDAHWTFVVWYFGRTHHISVTEITENYQHNNYDFADRIFQQIYNVTNLSIKSIIVDYTYNQPNTTEADTYSWDGNLFPIRKKITDVLTTSSEQHTLTRKKRQTNKNKSSSTLKGVNNEPELGALVLVKSIDIIDKYLTGIARHPFYTPRANFIIIISDDHVTPDLQTKSALVLEKLWRIYGILNSILIITCSDDQIIGYYDPFSKKPDTAQLNVTDKNNYGIFRFIPLSQLNYESGWIVRKSRNLRGYPVITNIFKRTPTFLGYNEIPKTFLTTYYSNILTYANGYGGFDALVLANMAKALNFTAVINEPPNYTYGYVLDNGSYTGSMADVIYHKADVSFNARFLTNYNTSEIEFLFPVFGDKLCIIAPKALKVPQWKAIFKCFNGYVWAILVLINSFCGYFWYLLKKWSLKSMDFHQELLVRSNLHYKLSTTSIDMWTIMLAGPTLMPFRTLERLFMCSCLITNIIIIGTFQGSLTTSFSTTSRYKDINTLSDLDATGLPIIVSSKSIANLFGNDTDVAKSLSSKFSIRNITAIKFAATTRDMCGVERFSDINIIIATTYELHDGSKLLNVVKECPRMYHLSYIVRKGWPLGPRFTYTLQKLFESGLLFRWYQEMEDSFILTVRYERSLHAQDNLEAFTLVDMQTAFYIYGIGMFVCLIVFLVEFFLLKYL